MLLTTPMGGSVKGADGAEVKQWKWPPGHQKLGLTINVQVVSRSFTVILSAVDVRVRVLTHSACFCLDQFLPQSALYGLHTHHAAFCKQER